MEGQEANGNMRGHGGVAMIDAVDIVHAFPDSPAQDVQQATTPSFFAGRFSTPKGALK
jgi:hypothetical protein